MNYEETSLEENIMPDTGDPQGLHCTKGPQ